MCSVVLAHKHVRLISIDLNVQFSWRGYSHPPGDEPSELLEMGVHYLGLAKLGVTPEFLHFDTDILKSKFCMQRIVWVTRL